MHGRFAKFNILLVIAAVALIPVSTVSNVCFSLIGIQGFVHFIRNFKSVRQDSRQRLFFIFALLYWVPIGISLVDAVRFMKPFTHIFLGHLPYYFAGVFLIDFLKPPERRAIVLKGFFWAVVIWGIDAVIQFVFGCDLLGYERASRIGGPFKDLGHLGYYFGPMSAFILLYVSLRQWPKYIGILLFCFTAFIIIQANTRAGWLMFLIVTMAFMFTYIARNVRYKKSMLIGILSAVLVLSTCAYFFSPNVHHRIVQTAQVFKGDRASIDKALNGRLAAWIASVRICKEHPVNGVGPRCFRYVSDDYNPEGYEDRDVLFPHQLVLEFAVGMGTFGLIGLAGQYFICFLIWKRTPQNVKPTAFPAAIALFALYFPLSSHRDHLGTEHSMVCWLVITVFFALSQSISTVAAEEPEA
jgi:O-antigen ligase